MRRWGKDDLLRRDSGSLGRGQFGALIVAPCVTCTRSCSCWVCSFITGLICSPDVEHMIRTRSTFVDNIHVRALYKNDYLLQSFEIVCFPLNPIQLYRMLLSNSFIQRVTAVGTDQPYNKVLFQAVCCFGRCCVVSASTFGAINFRTIDISLTQFSSIFQLPTLRSL